MGRTVKIETLDDILELTEDEFGRFLVDLTHWHGVTRQVRKMLNIPVTPSMVWTDDGVEGCTGVTINGLPTGG